jgi:hypothetical protein
VGFFIQFRVTSADENCVSKEADSKGGSAMSHFMRGWSRGTTTEGQWALPMASYQSLCSTGKA